MLTGLMARLILEHAQISSPALRTEAGAVQPPCNAVEERTSVRARLDVGEGVMPMPRRRCGVVGGDHDHAVDADTKTPTLAPGHVVDLVNEPPVLARICFRFHARRNMPRGQPSLGAFARAFSPTILWRARGSTPGHVMPDCAREREHLARADWHIAEAKGHIARQQEFFQQLIRDGRFAIH
jgi:hypothetical protein